MRRTRSFRFLALALCAALIASCSQPVPPPTPDALVLEMNPSGRAPLAGTLRFNTDRPARATLVISDADHRETITPEDGFVTQHDIMLLGFRPSRTHTVELMLEGEDGSHSEMPAASLTVDTPALPENTPSVDVTLSRPAVMEPGVTLVPLFRWIDFQIDQNYGQILALDAQGEVVWIYEAPTSVLDLVLLDNGNLAYSGAGFRLTEIDMLGNVVHAWYPRTFKNPPSDGTVDDTDTFHHNVLELPSGNFMVLSTELRQIPNWYTSETDPDAPRKTQTIVGDLLVEFDRSGRILRQWKLTDLLDPYRIGYGSLDGGFYAPIYGGVVDPLPPDWTHHNGTFYDAATDSVLISTNHLSTVMKLDLKSGELRWLLGDPRGWNERLSRLSLKPEDPNMIWSFHHHAPKWTPAGTLMLYDNGAGRARPFDPPLTAAESFSRVVEYAIDEANGTVREVWTYGGPGDEHFLSAIISEADWLPQTGNILVTNGAHVEAPDGSMQMYPQEGRTWISLAEVTHTMPAEKVWEVVIDDPAVGWTAFRTDRVPSLYQHK